MEKRSLFRRILDDVVVALICGMAILLLPVLLLSSRARQWLFVRVLVFASRLWRDCFEEARRETMTALDDIESRDSELRADGAVRVLEIGAGFGANFNMMRRKVKYWNVDPNTEFQSAFLETLKEYPQVEMERWVAGYGEDMHQVPDNHFDAVIITHLLCSVDCAEKVLQECRRVLVKGGRLLFLEHVAQPEGSLVRRLQSFLTPLWRIVCCGCCLNRDSANVIRNAGFAEMHMKETRVEMPAILTRHVYGYAVA
uniref:Methyltransferase type 11 domain-containing protein n=1 Tax=Amblyomma maculatum TaxID=34609 RepID=G3MPY5_AMBMU